jgi:hypothetical protein
MREILLDGYFYAQYIIICMIGITKTTPAEKVQDTVSAADLRAGIQVNLGQLILLMNLSGII